MLNVVDEFTREALEILVARRIDADATVAVLERLVAGRGAPAHVRCDNGPELTAHALRDWCRLSKTSPPTGQRGRQCDPLPDRRARGAQLQSFLALPTDSHPRWTNKRGRVNRSGRKLLSGADDQRLIDQEPLDHRGQAAPQHPDRVHIKEAGLGPVPHARTADTLGGVTAAQLKVRCPPGRSRPPTRASSARRAPRPPTAAPCSPACSSGRPPAQAGGCPPTASCAPR